MLNLSLEAVNKNLENSLNSQLPQLIQPKSFGEVHDNYYWIECPSEHNPNQNYYYNVRSHSKTWTRPVPGHVQLPFFNPKSIYLHTSEGESSSPRVSDTDQCQNEDNDPDKENVNEEKFYDIASKIFYHGSRMSKRRKMPNYNQQDSEVSEATPITDYLQLDYMINNNGKRLRSSSSSCSSSESSSESSDVSGSSSSSDESCQCSCCEIPKSCGDSDSEKSSTSYEIVGLNFSAPKLKPITISDLMTEPEKRRKKHKRRKINPENDKMKVKLTPEKRIVEINGVKTISYDPIYTFVNRLASEDKETACLSDSSNNNDSPRSARRNFDELPLYIPDPKLSEASSGSDSETVGQSIIISEFASNNAVKTIWRPWTKESYKDVLGGKQLRIQLTRIDLKEYFERKNCSKEKAVKKNCWRNGAEESMRKDSDETGRKKDKKTGRRSREICTVPRKPHVKGHGRKSDSERLSCPSQVNLSSSIATSLSKVHSDIGIFKRGISLKVTGVESDDSSVPCSRSSSVSEENVNSMRLRSGRISVRPDFFCATPSPSRRNSVLMRDDEEGSSVKRKGRASNKKRDTLSETPLSSRNFVLSSDNSGKRKRSLKKVRMLESPLSSRESSLMLETGENIEESPRSLKKQAVYMVSSSVSPALSVASSVSRYDNIEISEGRRTRRKKLKRQSLERQDSSVREESVNLGINLRKNCRRGLNYLEISSGEYSTLSEGEKEQKGKKRVGKNKRGKRVRKSGNLEISDNQTKYCWCILKDSTVDIIRLKKLSDDHLKVGKIERTVSDEEKKREEKEKEEKDKEEKEEEKEVVMRQDTVIDQGRESNNSGSLNPQLSLDLRNDFRNKLLIKQETLETLMDVEEIDEEDGTCKDGVSGSANQENVNENLSLVVEQLVEIDNLFDRQTLNLMNDIPISKNEKNVKEVLDYMMLEERLESMLDNLNDCLDNSREVDSEKMTKNLKEEKFSLEEKSCDNSDMKDVQSRLFDELKESDNSFVKDDTSMMKLDEQSEQIDVGIDSQEKLPQMESDSDLNMSFYENSPMELEEAISGIIKQKSQDEVVCEEFQDLKSAATAATGLDVSQELKSIVFKESQETNLNIVVGMFSILNADQKVDECKINSVAKNSRLMVKKNSDDENTESIVKLLPSSSEELSTESVKNIIGKLDCVDTIKGIARDEVSFSDDECTVVIENISSNSREEEEVKNESVVPVKISEQSEIIMPEDNCRILSESSSIITKMKVDETSGRELVEKSIPLQSWTQLKPVDPQSDNESVPTGEYWSADSQGAEDGGNGGEEKEEEKKEEEEEEKVGAEKNSLQDKTLTELLPLITDDSLSSLSGRVCQKQNHQGVLLPNTLINLNMYENSSIDSEIARIFDRSNSLEKMSITSESSACFVASENLLINKSEIEGIEDIADPSNSFKSISSFPEDHSALIENESTSCRDSVMDVD